MTLYKDSYPLQDRYNFPTTEKHESPCMSEFWRSQPIRQGKVRDEIDFDEKEDEDDLC